jgi:hypothetical protein
MPPRKRRRETQPIRIDVRSRERLDSLKTALEHQGLPEYVDQVDIVSALVLFATPEQLAGMLAAYWRSTEKLHSAGGSSTTSAKEGDMPS